MNTDLVTSVEQACTQLLDDGVPVTFTAVASRIPVSKATLYRRPELRSIIEEHRTRDREANTLTGLTVQLGHLHHGLEAVAAKVRRHEELLRDLQHRRQNTR
jgi:hypothetical protein